MSANPQFNETRAITELMGYNWKVTMMFKLEDLPVRQIVDNIMQMANIVDSLPSERHLTEEWKDKVLHLLAKLMQVDSSHFQQDGNTSTSTVSTIGSSSTDNHLPICRQSDARSPLNILLDVQSFTFNYSNEKNEATSQSYIFVSYRSAKVPRKMNCVLALPKRRSHSTEAIRQAIQDTSIEERPQTVISKCKKALVTAAPICGENQTEKMRNLLAILVKCRIILRAYKISNKYLERTIFNWVVLKLNADLMKEFCQNHFQPTFSGLISFCTKKLCMVTNPTTTDKMGKICFYCKFPGHFVRDCPKTKVITCFKCFQLGHSRHLCINEKATPNQLLDSL